METRSSSAQRITAIDALRGTALVLMALTHAAFFIGVGMQAESYGGQPVFLQSLVYVFSGLLTTLASPIFFFLAGTSLALLEASQLRRGASQASITRFMVIRAVVILVLDLTICNWFWLGKTPYIHVLTSIALSMLPLSIARSMPTRAIFIVALVTLLVYQGMLLVLEPQLLANTPQSLLQALFLTYSYETRPAVGFPLLGWAPILWLGFVLGRSVAQPTFQHPQRWLLLGLGLLASWLVLRLFGGYGDLGAMRPGASLIEFVVMSKAPPSLTYLTFKLGIAALIMAGLVAWPWLTQQGPLRFLVIIGQASLFFYVAHILVYHILARLFLSLPLPALPGIVYGYAIWLVGLILLIGLTWQYRNLRRRYPQSFLRYL